MGATCETSWGGTRGLGLKPCLHGLEGDLMSSYAFPDCSVGQKYVCVCVCV